MNTDSSRSDSPYRVMVVCTGNICRSPMGEFLLREAIDDVGLGDRVVIDSTGTTSWQADNPADSRTIAALRRRGHTDVGWREHRARKITPADLGERDLVLAADAGHLRELRTMAGAGADTSHVRLLREFDSAAAESGDLEIDDPWYGDDADFDRTYAEITAAIPGILAHIRRAL